MKPFHTRIETIAAAVLVLGFFLPWVSVFIVSYSGLELPRVAASAGYSRLIYLIYLMPIFAAISLFRGFHARDAIPSGVVAASVPLVILGYGFLREGTRVLDMLDIGAFVSGAAAIAMYAIAYPRLGNITRSWANKLPRPASSPAYPPAAPTYQPSASAPKPSASRERKAAPSDEQQWCPSCSFRNSARAATCDNCGAKL